MNGYTRDIAKFLGIDLDKALKIQNLIDKNDLLDWSECSQRKFEAVVNRISKTINL